MLSAASCNKWWMDEIFKTKDYAGEQKEIAKLGENSVFFLPYLMGERSPHNDAAVRGSFTGLSLDTTRADIYQAVLEGVAFGIRDMLEAGRKAGYAPEESCICGGGAKSPLWRQIIANVTGLKLITVENDEGPSYGGAILAAVGCGEFATVAQASEAVTKTGDITVPEKELIEKYNDRYAHYTAIYPAVKDLYR
jgi:xylulokinase